MDQVDTLHFGRYGQFFLISSGFQEFFQKFGVGGGKKKKKKKKVSIPEFSVY